MPFTLHLSHMVFKSPKECTLITMDNYINFGFEIILLFSNDFMFKHLFPYSNYALIL